MKIEGLRGHIDHAIDLEDTFLGFGMGMDIRVEDKRFYFVEVFEAGF